MTGEAMKNQEPEEQVELSPAEKRVAEANAMDILMSGPARQEEPQPE